MLTRRAFEKHAQAHIDTGRYACVMVDLNHFKLLNDTYGHETGDEMLQKTAQILTNYLDHCALIGRRGGDEFIVLIQIPSSLATDTEQTLWINHLLAPVCAELRSLHHIGEDNTTVSAAIGISIGNPVTHSTLPCCIAEQTKRCTTPKNTENSTRTGNAATNTTTQPTRHAPASDSGIAQHATAQETANDPQNSLSE